MFWHADCTGVRWALLCFVFVLYAKPQAAGVLTNHSCFQSLFIAEGQGNTLGFDHLSCLLKLLGHYTKQFAITVSKLTWGSLKLVCFQNLVIVAYNVNHSLRPKYFI